MAEPLYSYGRYGFKLDVYPGYVKVAQGVYSWAMKRHTISMRTITDVSISPVLGKVFIHTNDGKVYEYMMGLKAPEVKEAIEEALNM